MIYQIAWMTGMLLLGSLFPVHAQKTPADEVNPFIGTDNAKPGMVNWKNGATYPGAVTPWGMVSVSPYNAPGSKSGYLFGKPFLYGFGHVHLSGVGCSELGSVVVMPGLGAIPAGLEPGKSAYGSEVASPGYYHTVLEPSGIVCEMTSTTRSGLSRYTFPQGTGDAHILIDASFSLNSRIMPARGEIHIVNDSEVAGWTQTGHFCGAADQKERVCFVALFSRPALSSGTWKGDIKSGSPDAVGRGVGAFLDFGSDSARIVLVKVGISYVSIEDARENLMAEQPGWDFEGISREAKADWNKVLSRFEVKGGTADERVQFYTGLYHMLIHPSVFSDVNGSYTAMNSGKVLKAKGYLRYDVFSLWDTYRALHPFLTMFYPGREHDMTESILHMYRESGWLPKWELAGHDARVMVGDPAGIMLAETYINGLHDFDLPLAYEAMKHNADDTTGNRVRRLLGAYLKYHYVPSNIRGSVSMTLEYGVSDYAISKVAGILGFKAEQERFLSRSQYYQNLYDTATGFLRPRNSEGSWYLPFDPDKFKGTGFIEGSAWNYLFAAAYDLKGLSHLMGGDSVVVARLRSVFDRHRYAAYNEPDIAYPYLFGYYPGAAREVGDRVTEILRKNYRNAPGGIPGNDDCGALSAWYVFSALGFYPADPLSGNYVPGRPVFDTVTIHLDQQYYPGKMLKIITRRLPWLPSRDGVVKFNGEKIDLISHLDIENGGILEFDLPRALNTF